ncbi:MAG: alpha/beta fold hydrolase [Phycisphaerales bacterium]
MPARRPRTNWLVPALMAAAASTALAQPTFNEVVFATEPVNGGTFALTFDVYQATTGTGPRPVVLWIHGGGWSGGTHNQVPTFALDLRAQGITVVSVEYRLSGQAIFPAQIEDVKGAVRYLRAHAAQFNIDPTRIGAWGSSAGGHLAALLATSGGVAELEGDSGGNLGFSSAIQVAADYFGPTDILNMPLDVTTPPGTAQDHDLYTSAESALIGFNQPGQGIGVLRANLENPAPPFPEKAHLVNLVNPITHVDPNDPPMYIAHGDSDTTVPRFQSVRLKDALDAAGVEYQLRIVAGAGHGDLGAQTNSEAAAFLVSKLIGSEPCAAPRVVQQPFPARTCPDGTSAFVTSVAGTSPALQWQWRPSPTQAWRAVVEGANRNVANGRVLFTAQGTATDRLLLTSLPNNTAASSLSRRDIRVAVSNACGSVESNIVFWLTCPSDYTCDGATDGDDVIAFMADWDAGLLAADFNGDGGTDGDDVVDYFVRWDAGC